MGAVRVSNLHVYCQHLFISSTTGTNNVDWKPLVNGKSIIKILFIKSNVSDVISLFPKISISNDVDFVNFNDRLTLVLLVFPSCVIEKAFPVLNVTLFLILCFGVSLMLSMLLYLGISGDDVLNFVELLNGVEVLGAEIDTLQSGSVSSNSGSTDKHKSESGARL